MLSTYERIGIASEYSECIRSYASLAAGGQVTSGGGGDLLGSLLGGLLGRRSTQLRGQLGIIRRRRRRRWSPARSLPRGPRLQQVHRQHGRLPRMAGRRPHAVSRRVPRGQPLRRLRPRDHREERAARHRALRRAMEARPAHGDERLPGRR